MSSPGNIFRLKAGFNSYDWGKKGHESLVANYIGNATGETNIQEDRPYAELWIGTHPNNPSYLWSDPSKSLQGLIQASPTTYLGQALTAPFGSPLNPNLTSGTGRTPHSTHVPYLFKVLSMALALPLQSHPSKALARKLHELYPKQFVDSNYKPEIAVAIEDGFRGFVGFGEHKWIKRWLQEIPELRDAIGNDEAIEAYLEDSSKEGLKRVYESLLIRDASEVEESVVSLVRKIERQGPGAICGDANTAEVVKLLHSEYGGDVGVFAAPFFMNLVTLNKGEAIFIPADTVHAYLDGDIIECMATSDNVLNSGFVPPSARQTDVFVSSLSYDALPASAFALPYTPYKKSGMDKTIAYDPPIDDFTVLWTRIPSSDAGKVEERNVNVRLVEVLEAVKGPTACIVTKGQIGLREEGKVDILELPEGGVGFIKPGTIVEVLRCGNSEGALDIWWAMWDQD